jgi:hypothetical protein
VGTGCCAAAKKGSKANSRMVRDCLNRVILDV